MRGSSNDEEGSSLEEEPSRAVKVLWHHRQDLRAVRELAQRKLGLGATVNRASDGWVAQLKSTCKRTRVTGGTLETLKWFLEQMPDALVGADAPKKSST